MVQQSLLLRTSINFALVNKISCLIVRSLLHFSLKILFSNGTRKTFLLYQCYFMQIIFALVYCILWCIYCICCSFSFVGRFFSPMYTFHTPFMQFIVFGLLLGLILDRVLLPVLWKFEDYLGLVVAFNSTDFSTKRIFFLSGHLLINSNYV